MWKGILYFQKKSVRVLYMSFHSYRVVFCAPIIMGPRTLDFRSCTMSYTFKLHGEGIRGSQALSIFLQGWAPDESFLYGHSRHLEHEMTGPCSHDDTKKVEGQSPNKGQKAMMIRGPFVHIHPPMKPKGQAHKIISRYFGAKQSKERFKEGFSILSFSSKKSRR